MRPPPRSRQARLAAKTPEAAFCSSPPRGSFLLRDGVLFGRGQPNPVACCRQRMARLHCGWSTDMVTRLPGSRIGSRHDSQLGIWIELVVGIVDVKGFRGIHTSVGIGGVIWCNRRPMLLLCREARAWLQCARLRERFQVACRCCIARCGCSSRCRWPTDAYACTPLASTRWTSASTRRRGHTRSFCRGMLCRCTRTSRGML
mmetsp:Transcript_39851/g.105276  ORF Transcript_39851/g.105276 Transcript_39851/m.105276 type:complete len:202 (+) Transcript_39851:328-933(+)